MEELTPTQRCKRRSIRDVRMAGLAAIDLLAEAQRLRAQAVADMVEFHAIDGHIAEGYLTPQRQMIEGAGLSENEANRMTRLVRFCETHPLIAEQLASGCISIEHADALMKLAAVVNSSEFADALPDLLQAGVGVELAVFCDRIRVWQWRIQPEATEEDLDTHFDNRRLVTQDGLFGGLKGNFEVDAAAGAIIRAGLFTSPDPTNTVEGPRSLAQRQADRLVELAALGANIDDEMFTSNPDGGCVPGGEDQPEGARQLTRPTVDVIIDLPTLLGLDFDLDHHRNAHGDVDWESIEASFTLGSSAPRPVMQQFFCDASWRTLITAGGSTVLDYTHARPELNRGQRRAVQRRDRRCQFQGCDRHWTWCDVHHLLAKEDGGWDLFANLVLLCRRHHTMVHQQGWQLRRDTDGRIQTTAP